MCRIFPALLCAACLPLLACAPKVPVTGTRPAEVALPGVKTLYVMHFSGEYGFDARRCLLATLAASSRFMIRNQEIDERPDNVSNRSWAEVRGSAVTDVDDVRGFDTVAYNEVTDRDVTVYDASGKAREYREVIRERKIESVEYVSRNAKLAVTVSTDHEGNGGHDGHDVRNEKTLTWTRSVKYGGSQTHPKSNTYRASAPKLSDMNGFGMELTGAACDLGTRLGRRLLPEAYVLDVELADDGGELVQAGVEHAQQGNWPAAEALWRKAVAASPANAAALYNLGVASERRGSGLFDRAREYYVQALERDDADIFAAGLQRIDGRIAEAAELQRQLAD